MSLKDITTIRKAFSFLTHDYQYSLNVHPSFKSATYKGVYQIHCDLDPRKGLSLAIKPVFDPDIANVGLLELVDFFSKGSFPEPDFQIDPDISRFIQNQAMYFRTLMLNYCEPLLLNDKSWWAAAYRYTINLRGALSMRGNSLSPQQTIIMAYINSIK
jgi:hypothetical protein